MFNTSNWKKNRLDTFTIHFTIGSKQEFCELWSIYQLVLRLLQGNAGFESGFSVNGVIFIEDMKETSHVAQRQVNDAIICKGSGFNVEIRNKSLS